MTSLLPMSIMFRAGKIILCYYYDEGRHTSTAFNLHYDGGIFIGIYNHIQSSTLEPFPEGISVSYNTKLHSSLSTTTFMRGTVISVPISQPQNGISLSDQDVSPYVIQLIDGSVHQVFPDVLEKLVIPTPNTSHKICFPSWFCNQQKVMYLHEGLHAKGVMEWCLDMNSWRFSQRQKNGSEIFAITLPNFLSRFPEVY